MNKLITVLFLFFSLTSFSQKQPVGKPSLELRIRPGVAPAPVMNIYEVQLTISDKEGTGLKEKTTHHLYHITVLVAESNAIRAKKKAIESQRAVTGFASDFDDEDYIVTAGKVNCIISNR
jgi:hypothetical protein